MWARWRARIDRLIEPHASITGAEARRSARYTLLFLLILLPLALAALVLTIVEQNEIEPLGFALGDELVMAATSAVLAVFYFIGRGRHTRIAAWGSVIVTALSVWAAWSFDPSRETSITNLFYLVVPVFMAGLFLSTAGAIVFVAANIVATLSLAFWLSSRGAMELYDATNLPFFLLVVGIFVVNAARVRHRDLGVLERTSEALRTQEQMRVMMLNNVAHDLGSPLTPLKLQVAMIPKDKPVAPERVDVLKRNITQLERLVSDLKDLARLDAGGFKLFKKPGDLRETASAAVEAFRAEAQTRGVTLEASLDGQLPIEADPERITQVVYNLVTNALKFTPSGGRVVVRAYRDGAEARVAVTDTGRGLAADEMARLFKPFSQVHQRDEVKERGTGLGLHISRGIAEAHGGRTWVESEGRGKGSTFTLALPLRA